MYRIYLVNHPGRLFKTHEGGCLFEGGRLLFSQTFQQARIVLENNKTRDDKFISLQQDKTK